MYKIKLFFSIFTIFIIDFLIKKVFLNGYSWDSSCISFSYVLNKGVAFSLFSSLGENLKWILLFTIIVMFLLFLKEGWLKSAPILCGFLFGSAIANLFDRFKYGGVVDYIHYHCYFDFAVFNFADIMINISIFLLLFFTNIIKD